MYFLLLTYLNEKLKAMLQVKQRQRRRETVEKYS